MKHIIIRLLPFFDLLFFIFLIPMAFIFKLIRKANVNRLPLCKWVLLKVGVFPIRNHYYEPQFNYLLEDSNFSKNRNLPGIDWNESSQLKLLEQLNFSSELMNFSSKIKSNLTFHFNNGQFESGDAEFWYQIIRKFKPRRIIEIGSGYSTMIAKSALDKNKCEDANYICEHICIEPFEASYLEKLNVQVIRKKVEDMHISFFKQLNENDILFIDSSHMIRPRGDILFEYLEILPNLNKGVIVHIHDIFSPRNYPLSWLKDEVKFWNEQYLLEAFLSHNQRFEIIGALNFLHHTHYDKLKAVAPYLTPDREPGSFYIKSI